MLRICKNALEYKLFEDARSCASVLSPSYHFSFVFCLFHWRWWDEFIVWLLFSYIIHWLDFHCNYVFPSRFFMVRVIITWGLSGWSNRINYFLSLLYVYGKTCVSGRGSSIGPVCLSVCVRSHDIRLTYGQEILHGGLHTYSVMSRRLLTSQLDVTPSCDVTKWHHLGKRTLKMPDAGGACVLIG